MALVRQDHGDWHFKVQRKTENLRGLESGCEFAEAIVPYHQNPGGVFQV